MYSFVCFSDPKIVMGVLLDSRRFFFVLGLTNGKKDLKSAGDPREQVHGRRPTFIASRDFIRRDSAVHYERLLRIQL